MMVTPTINICDLPYNERKVIVILPENPEKSNVDWSKIGLAASIPQFLLPPAYSMVINLLNIHQKPKEKKEQGHLFLPIDFESSQQLEFLSQPVEELAYVGHPQVPRKYIPMAEFHSTIFDEKVNELTYLLASLGASYVKASYIRGYQNKLSGNAGLQVKKVVDFETKGERHLKVQQEAIIEEHYSPTGVCEVPDDLVWFNVEPNWKELAKRREKFGTIDFHITLDYVRDYGVNASLKSKLEGFGFNLGGDFTEFESTEWEFQGEYYPFP